MKVYSTRKTIYPSLLLLIALASSVKARAAWGYNDEDKWEELDDSECDGKFQSPINIVDVCTDKKENVVVDRNLKLKFINYDQEINASRIVVKNNGHTAMLTIKDTESANVEAPMITGTAVGFNVFQLGQIHFHWDRNATHAGSEHGLFGHKRAFEIHLVHFNAKYGSDDDAAEHPDGAAVLSLLFDYDECEDGDNNDKGNCDDFENKAIAPITKKLRSISEADKEVTVDSNMNFMKLFPDDKDTFYWYQGSLTTPPCSEDLTWIVFPQVQRISKKQLESFWMTLDTEDGKVLGTTNREMKDLNGRLLLVSNDDYCDSEEYKRDIKNHLAKEDKKNGDKDSESKDGDDDDGDNDKEDDDDDDEDSEDNGKSNNKSSGDDKSDQKHSSVKEVFEDAIITTSDEDREVWTVKLSSHRDKRAPWCDLNGDGVKDAPCPGPVDDFDDDPPCSTPGCKDDDGRKWCDLDGDGDVDGPCPLDPAWCDADDSSLEDDPPCCDKDGDGDCDAADLAAAPDDDDDAPPPPPPPPGGKCDYDNDGDKDGPCNGCDADGNGVCDVAEGKCVGNGPCCDDDDDDDDDCPLCDYDNDGDKDGPCNGCDANNNGVCDYAEGPPGCPDANGDGVCDDDDDPPPPPPGKGAKNCPDANNDGWCDDGDDPGPGMRGGGDWGPDAPGACDDYGNGKNCGNNNKNNPPPPDPDGDGNGGGDDGPDGSQHGTLSNLLGVNREYGRYGKPQSVDQSGCGGGNKQNGALSNTLGTHC